MRKLLILDTFNFLHRAYHALPRTLTDSNGEPVNAVFGVTSMLINVLNQLHPSHVLSAVDSKEPTFRVEEFTGYKAQRKPMDEDLATQIPKVFEMLDVFGVARIGVSGYEADDVIATAVEKLQQDIEIVIVSNDRDLWQLVSDQVSIMLPGSKGENDWIHKKEAEERMGFDLGYIADYKGLRGDPSDNIPGVYGVGDKTAKKLIGEFGTVEDIYKHLEDVSPASLKRKLEESYEQALMSKKLAQLIRNAPFEVTLDDLRYSGFAGDSVKGLLERYNFKSLIKRLGLAYSDEAPESQLKLF